ncbi:MAG: hypothetical protein KDD53_09170, partial [Bdellovibrionales bacterium]|nr:hypothetical protein [Bdellovibrionales bacterium]
NLLNNLPSGDQYWAVLAEGYFNIRFRRLRDFRSVVPSNWLGPGQTLEPNYVSIVSPPAVRCQGWSYVRMATCALMHALILSFSGAKGIICIGAREEDLSSLRLRDDLWYLSRFKEVLESASEISESSADLVEDKVLSALQSDSLPTVFAWTLGPLFSRQSYHQLSKADSLSRFVPCYPEHRWLFPIGTTLGCKDVLSRSDADLIALSIYLMGGSWAHDLDPLCAFENERRNTLWALSAFCRRFDRIYPSIEPSKDLRLNPNFGRDLLIRTQCLSAHFHRARDFGEVSRFFAALEESVRLGHDELNRIMSSKESRDRQENAVVTETYSNLSAINTWMSALFR